MIIDVLTIFPGVFSPILGESIIKRAQEKGLVKIIIHNLRDYSKLAHRKIDAPSYGGGPGMVIRPEPVFDAVESILGYSLYPNQEKKEKDNKKRIIFFTPQGKILNQRMVKGYLEFNRLILLTGRYEGIDERIREYLVEEEISLGDYILSGGELPAMVFIDVLVRCIPGVVSCRDSIVKESFHNGYLDYPHYTRPRVFRGLRVPEVLLCGDHKKIEEWRKKKAIELTKKVRPDLLEEKK
ncbi:MAG: tRNA (guanosine(37)-N1)-methyltransferase TrmD [Candidatus Omnitrophica bacterium]|nr:tRNA (guanosine(37)-N1)-methyltransferase TrmD [Candidatus Omnitrophota bacterium]